MNDNLKISGKATIKTFKAGTKELIRSIGPFSNRVVVSDGYGKNIILRQIAGNTTYTIGIDSGAIGTGTNTPADSDTGLQTAVLSNIDLAYVEYSSTSEVVLSFFIPDASLTNGNYTEFGVFMDGRLFGRVLFGSTYSKGSGEDTTIEYTITIS